MIERGKLSCIKIGMALILNLQLLACGDQKKLTPQDNPEAALAQRSGPAAIRILSFALRDAPPTREEAMDYAAGQMTQSELIANFVAAPAHQNRIGRFFHDAFGAHAFPDTIFGQKALILDANGWYQSSENHPQCSSVQQLQNLEVWWGSKGETAPVCSLAECGAFALNCGLVRHRGQLMDAIRYEFRDLGTFVYNEGLSWDDLYAGTFFYGNRLLLHKYLLDATIANGKAHAYLANADTLRSVLDQLFTVPLEQNVRLEFTAIGPERAGLVTSPAFMQRYNNFRSRVRALTVGLLCEDIGPWMNPSGLTHFINSDSLSSFDLSHSKQDNCASCHLGMDNWGSTLLGWSDQGQWQWWKTWSQSGAVQGIEGAGPKFLMSRLLHENQQFSSCMAQKAWQSFGQGRTWESLSRVDQNILLQAAEVNPQTLLRTLFGLESLTQSR